MKKYYFLGIGGISMSALALMLKNEGDLVAGSDIAESKVTKLLQENYIHVDFDFNSKNIDKADIIVFSSAIKDENLQLRYAKTKKKKLMSRGELLGQLAGKYEKVIAVAGSHGKTTTTAMIFEILQVAGLKPTLHLGGLRLVDDNNYILGDRQFFVTEACEYHDNFLNLFPYISVITNVEKEHMDYFHTFERQLKSFLQFKNQSKMVIENCQDYSAKNIRHDKNGKVSFTLFYKNEKVFRLKLHLCEEINVQNCVYAYQVGKLLKLPDHIIKQGLEHFRGVHSRFEKVECPYFDNVIIDYAHHPTEIEKAIKSAKKIYNNKKLVTIFQPHTYSRTLSLYEDFIKDFKDEEMPIFYKTYSAREREEEGMSAKEFTKNLQKINKNAEYFENFQQLFKFLMELKSKDVVLLFLGAGDLPNILNKNKFTT